MSLRSISSSFFCVRQKKKARLLRARLLCSPSNPGFCILWNGQHFASQSQLRCPDLSFGCTKIPQNDPIRDILLFPNPSAELAFGKSFFY